LAPNIIAADNSVAIRIVKDEFCQKLIRDLGKPIVSTSANLSGSLSPKSYNDIDKTLLKKVDYVVDLHRDKIQSTASQLVKFGSTGKIEFLRK
ncbi:Threonylcarbamoyl-AMP synthase, partial [hydrothermal vent metagenome]